VSEPLDLDPEDLLGTIEQVEETLTIMTTVVSQLKEQLMEQLGVVDTRDMSVEEFLEFCENSDGVLH
jgi:NDP-sugar pyrophosphorylase family protein